jgi:ABC-type multidrug transport system fused ATPase/permease subunit
MYASEVQLSAYGNSVSWCVSGSPECVAGLDSYHNDSVRYMAGLIGFSFYSLVPFFFQFFLMAKIEEEITHNLRKRVFNKLMNMPVAWYDRPENEGGQIAAKLSMNVKEASPIVSAYIPILVSNFATCACGIAIALAYLWQLGLISLYAIPAIAIGGYISMLFVGGYED